MDRNKTETEIANTETPKQDSHLENDSEVFDESKSNDIDSCHKDHSISEEKDESEDMCDNEGTTESENDRFFLPEEANKTNKLFTESDDEYHSAEDGETDIDEEQMKKIEEELSEEEKKERKEESRTYKEAGNKLFKDGEYEAAIKSYKKGLLICPLAYPKDRSVLFSNKAACYLRLEKYEKALEACTKALDLNPDYLKALLRRAEIYEKLDKLEDALEDYKKVVEMDPSQHAARAACVRLPEEINDRNEKMKTEMIGKLKELGNMILKPFGLSTNNFQLNKDPQSGSYSVNFKQNPN